MHVDSASAHLLAYAHSRMKALIERIKAMPKDPKSSLGYSVIPVHAWSHSYDDIVTVVSALQAAGGFDVVLPSELLRRVKENIGASGNGTVCSCGMPGGGTAGKNGYSCSDGSRGFCASNEVCFADTPFPKGEWAKGCRVPAAVTCRCDTPSAGTAGHNHYKCSDGTSGYCAANQICYASLFDKGDWASGCRVGLKAF